MAYQKNLDRAMKKKNRFPVQVELWNKIYERGDLNEAANAIGKNAEWLSQVLDGRYDLKWSLVKTLCDYLGIDNPRDVIV